MGLVDRFEKKSNTSKRTEVFARTRTHVPKTYSMIEMPNSKISVLVIDGRWPLKVSQWMDGVFHGYNG